MEIRELERIRFVTRHFNDLQGLRYWVPVGLVTLGLGGTTLLRVSLFLGALLLVLRAKGYYRNTFGRVELELDPATALYPVSIFGPAGPVPRLEGPQQVTPMARYLFFTMALAVVVFSYFQAIPPNILVQEDAALGQHPQIVPESAPFFGPPWIGGYPNGGSRVLGRPVAQEEEQP